MFRASPVVERGFSLFSQVIESNGKLSRHLNLSQVKWKEGVPKCEIPRIKEVRLLSLRMIPGIAQDETRLTLERRPLGGVTGGVKCLLLQADAESDFGFFKS